MFWLKACPRCHGDLHDINEVGDRYVACLQCGRILTTEQEKMLLRATLRPLPHAVRVEPAIGAA